MVLIFIQMDLYNLYDSLSFSFFKFLFYPFISALLFIFPYLKPVIYLVFTNFHRTSRLCHSAFDAVPLSKRHFSHTSMHPLTDTSTCCLNWLGPIQWERQLSFFLCVIRVLCISSWMLGPKFISLHSQNNSSFLAGNNFKMSFAERLHPLSQGKNSTRTCAFTVQECLSHCIWFKWFVVSGLYLYCSSSFYLQNIGQAFLSLHPVFYLPFSVWPETGIVCCCEICRSFL